MYSNYAAFDDANQHAQAICGWDQRYDQIGQGAFRSFVKQAATDTVQVFQESANVRIVQQGHLPPGRLTFGLILRGGTPFSFQGVEIDEAALIVTTGGKEFVLHSPPDMSMLAVTVDAQALARVADAEGLDLASGGLARHVLRIPPAAGMRAAQRLVEALEAVLAAPAAPAALPSTATAGSSASAAPARFTDAVTESILDLLAFQVPAREDRLTHACRADIVQRSHQLVLSRPEQPVSILDLAQSLRVSRRTIQTSFQSVTQMNPIAYLRAVRLAQVRRLLRTSPAHQVPVREAASRWGFTNLGHFASDYKAQFGELPSQTQRVR